MKDLINATHEDFEACLEEAFIVKSETGAGSELRLIEVKTLGTIDPNLNTRQPFSLLFRGPLEPAFQQQILELENSTVGEISLFLVPVGADEEGVLYDAMFN